MKSEWVTWTGKCGLTFKRSAIPDEALFEKELADLVSDIQSDAREWYEQQIEEAGK